MSNLDAQINEAIAGAKQAAVVPVQSSGGNVAVLPAGKPKTWDEAEAEASMAVDHYLKVDKYGLHVGDDKAQFDDMAVTIKLSEVILGDSVRYTAGGKTTYHKTYDGVRAVNGKPWAEVVQTAQQMDPNCKGDYPMAEIPMTLTESLKLKSGDVVEAGKRIGYTTSITGYKTFIAWAKEARAAYGEDAAVKVQLGWTPQKKNGNEWGEVTFTTVQ